MQAVGILYCNQHCESVKGVVIESDVTVFLAWEHAESFGGRCRVTAWPRCDVGGACSSSMLFARRLQMRGGP